jgi:putative transposase
LVLRIVGVAEATYYYQKKQKQQEQKTRVYSGGRPVPGYSLTKQGKPVSDEQIKEWLLELVSGEEGAYGYRKLTLCLKRQYGLVINKKKTYRLCQELDLLRPQRKIKFCYPKRLANNRKITGSNQLWEMDVKYVYIAGERRFLFLLSLIDVYDRAIVEYHMGQTCEARHAVQILQQSLWKRKQFEESQRPTIRTDNGPQFISHAFEGACEEFGVEHERIPPNTPNKNAHIESYHAALEDECLSRWEFETYAEAYSTISEYVRFYNERRFHGSLYDLSPVEFREAERKGEVKPLIVNV